MLVYQTLTFAVPDLFEDLVSIFLRESPNFA